MMIGKNLVYVRRLSQAQPLAFRVLRRIKVSCPLREKHGCPWEGDYGDLQSHLLSSSAHLQTSCQPNIKEAISDSLSDSDESALCCYDDDENEKRKIKCAKVANENGIINHQIDNDSQQQRIALAESFKIEANAKFSMKNYIESRALYQKALSVIDQEIQQKGTYSKTEELKMAAILHSNIAATFMMTREYKRCVESCSVAIDLDRTYVKAYVRKAKALVALGEFSESCTVLKTLLDDENKIGETSNERQIIETEYSDTMRLCDLMSSGERELTKKEFISAKATFGQLLKFSNASNVIINAARADLGLGLTDSSLRLSLQVLRSDPTCSEGFEVRGQTMHLMGDFDSALQLLKEGLRLNPDCERIKALLKTCRSVYENVKEARSAVFQRRFNDAINSINAAIELQTQHLLPSKAPLYSKLYTERAECFLRLKQFQNALSDASKAVYSLDDYIPAWIIMANALHGLGRHEEALLQMEDLMSKFENNDQIRRAYQKADFEVRKMRRPDFYSLFGVSALASEMELKKAYKVKAKELHPDRLSSGNFTDEQRKEAEKNFKLLGEGLEILSDSFKRQLYDEGYDQEAIRDRVAAAQQAAHRHGGVGRQYSHGH